MQAGHSGASQAVRNKVGAAFNGKLEVSLREGFVLKIFRVAAAICR
jgi:hypothetical protein